MSQPLHIKGTQIWDGDKSVQHDLFVKNGRIVDEKPLDALEVDLEGYTIFPGLINAHDHLELNHYPRTKFRKVYDNAHQWGEDVNARLNDEPFKTLRSYPLWDRVFIGGLKNLLCGATTVIHHGPPHKPMFRKDFPVRVLKKYGWAHSLHFNTEEEIIRSYKGTPKNVPWFIHLAEGTDEVAAGEYQRLKKMGCLGINTVPVHCVGLKREDVFDTHHIVREYGVGHGSQMIWIWCPTTNIYLLGETGHPRMGWNTGYRLGSDSRLTADGDLLSEINYVVQHWQKDYPRYSTALYIVTTPFFRWQHNLIDKVDHIHDDDIADFVIIKDIEHPAKTLCTSTRKELAMVMYEGIPQIGDPEMMAKFPHIQTVACILDGVEKRMNVDLAKQVHRCQLKERGLDVDDLPSGKRFIFF